MPEFEEHSSHEHALLPLVAAQHPDRESDEDKRGGHDEGANGIDFRRDPSPHGRPDVHGQRIVTSGEEKGHRDFVKRERE